MNEIEIIKVTFDTEGHSYPKDALTNSDAIIQWEVKADTT